MMKKMFERFWRADSSRNSATGGYGIGLSVASAICEKHGAKISAQKEENSLIISVMFSAI